MWGTQTRTRERERTLERDLASRLLQTAARLLDSTSSGPSTGSSRPSPPPLPPGYRIRTSADVVTVTPERRLALQLEDQVSRLPPQVTSPAPLPVDQQSSGKTITGGFSATTAASSPTDPGSPPDGSGPSPLQ